MVKTMLSLTPRMDFELRGMAKEQEISLSELVRKILQDFIERRPTIRSEKLLNDPESVRYNIVPGLYVKDRGEKEIPYFMGIDVGLKDDGTAVTVGHWTKAKLCGAVADFIEIDYCKVRYAELEGKAQFSIDDIAEWISDVRSKFNVVRGLMDHYYGELLLRLLSIDKQGNGLESRVFTSEFNYDIYKVLKKSIEDRQLRLPALEDVGIVPELLSLEVTYNFYKRPNIGAPNIPGTHDDLSDSVARMVYLAHEWKKSQKYSLNTESK